jgi:hypothetical protein
VALLREVDRAGAQAVLLEGGTAPRLSWRCSAGLTRLGDELGRLEPGPPPDWAANPPVQSPGTARTTTAQAVRHLLTSWVEARTDKDPALLVGLGYAETDALNQAARALLVEREQIGGPVLRSGGRSYQAGEQALALRRLAPALPPGTLLSVAEVDPRRRAAIVTWAGHTAVLDRADLAHVGYGYAVTPPLAARAPNPLMVLGPADAMGAHRARVIAATRDLSDMARAGDRGISLGMG